MLQIGIITNLSPFTIAIVTAIATAAAGHIFGSLRSRCRRKRRRDNLRTILISELRSNSERLWMVFAANECFDLFLPAGEKYHVQDEDSADIQSTKNRRRKGIRINFLAKQSDAGLYYTQYEAVTDQIGTLDRSEVQTIQTAYQNIKTLEGSLEKLSPSQQYIGGGDSVLTLERMAARGEIEANAQKALIAHLEAIRTLGAELTDDEEQQLEIANEDSPSKDEIERIHERVTENY